MLFTNQRQATAFVGMVHVDALPATPENKNNISTILERVEQDARALANGGVDAIIVENMGDLPYLRGHVGPEITSAMTLAVDRAMKASKLPIGIQILAAANIEAMAVASMTGAQFIRAEAFGYAHVADEGLLNANAADVLRYRKQLNSNVRIWADVHKKHASHAITADLSLEESAKGLAFCGTDVIIVTGAATGCETSIDDLKKAQLSKLPIAIGSGVTTENAHRFVDENAAALIVGSALKYDGNWRREVDVERVRKLRNAIDNTKINHIQ